MNFIAYKTKKLKVARFKTAFIYLIQKRAICTSINVIYSEWGYSFCIWQFATCQTISKKAIMNIVTEQTMELKGATCQRNILKEYYKY
jgi:hypothetical protein